MAHLLAKKPLSSWSWQEIQGVYKIHGRQLQEYAGVARRIKIAPSMDIKLTDQDNIFILRFWREVKRLDLSVTQLDREISRRQKLIGVMG